MHEIFSNLTHKDKKAFNELPNEEKAKIIQANVVDKIGGAMITPMADAMIQGISLAYERLYRQFVEPIDNSANVQEQQVIVARLLSELRLKHLEYEQRKNKQEVVNNEPNI